MFLREKCDLCGICLERCHYMDYDHDRAVEEFTNLVEGGPSDVPGRCITCFACNEYCEKGANPFDLILERQEETGALGISPEVIKGLEARYIPPGEFRRPKVSGKVMSACVLPSTDAHLFQGRLFENITLLNGRHYFCNILFLHLGNEGIVKERAKKVVENLAGLGVDEIIFYHDDCYVLMAVKAPEYGINVPFHPVHLVEYLLDYLKKHKDDIRTLNFRISYQRPCASRFSSWKEPLIDEIFDLIGVERVKRRYDRENALCCGGLSTFIRSEPLNKLQAMNVADAKDAGAETLVCLCPMCVHFLKGECKAEGIRTITLSELCQLALGE